MAIVINGSGTITGVSAGGLPTGSVTADTLATNSVDSAELIDGAIDDSHLASAAIAYTKMLRTDVPAFSVATTSDKSNQTGNNTVYTIAYDEELVDQGGNFSSTTFTAPVTGTYLLILQVKMAGITGALDTFNIRITTSNYPLYSDMTMANGWSTPSTRTLVSIVDMDASDTATSGVQANGEGSDVCDIKGGATASGIFTQFSGMLIT